MRKLNSELARAIPAVDGTRVLVNRTDRNMRTRSTVRALTDCKVTRADGSTYIIPKNTRKSTTRKRTPREITMKHIQTYHERVAQLGAIGNVE